MTYRPGKSTASSADLLPDLAHLREVLGPIYRFEADNAVLKRLYEESQDCILPVSQPSGFKFFPQSRECLVDHPKQWGWDYRDRPTHPFPLLLQNSVSLPYFRVAYGVNLGSLRGSGEASSLTGWTSCAEIGHVDDLCPPNQPPLKQAGFEGPLMQISGLPGIQILLGSTEQLCRLTPQNVQAMALELGLGTQYARYWLAYLGVAYGLPPFWEVYLEAGARVYFEVSQNLKQARHPLRDKWLAVESRLSASCHWCVECDQEKADFWCSRCEDAFCFTCWGLIHKWPTRRHSLIPLKGSASFTRGPHLKADILTGFPAPMEDSEVKELPGQIHRFAGDAWFYFPEAQQYYNWETQELLSARQIRFKIHRFSIKLETVLVARRFVLNVRHRLQTRAAVKIQAFVRMKLQVRSFKSVVHLLQEEVRERDRQQRAATKLQKCERGRQARLCLYGRLTIEIIQKISSHLEVVHESLRLQAVVRIQLCFRRRVALARRSLLAAQANVGRQWAPLILIPIYRALLSIDSPQHPWETQLSADLKEALADIKVGWTWANLLGASKQLLPALALDEVAWVLKEARLALNGFTQKLAKLLKRPGGFPSFHSLLPADTQGPLLATQFFVLFGRHTPGLGMDTPICRSLRTADWMAYQLAAELSVSIPMSIRMNARTVRQLVNLSLPIVVQASPQKVAQGPKTHPNQPNIGPDPKEWVTNLRKLTNQWGQLSQSSPDLRSRVQELGGSELDLFTMVVCLFHACLRNIP